MNEWTIRDHSRGRDMHRDSRAEGEDVLEEFKGDLELELLDPEGNTVAKNFGDDAEQDVEPDVVDHSEAEETTADGGKVVEADVVEETDEPTPEPAEPEPESTGSTYDLPERSVSDDPLQWVPGDFIDSIDGTRAINRKGFAVLGHFYKIETSSEVVVSPEETDFEFCRVKAVATTKDGREYEAQGSAHVDRGDDSYLLLEMADTRAKKRALADATGVGAVAVAELKNEVQS